MRPQQTVMPVVHVGVFGHFRQVPAHQREVMVLVGLADAADALQRVLVADVAAQGITRVGRVHDDSARTQRLGGLPYEALLR